MKVGAKAGWGWSAMRGGGGGWGGEGRREEGRGGEGGVTDTLVFDSSGGHHLRGKRALMGILSSRQAQASALLPRLP